MAYPIALLLALIAGIIIGFVLSGRIVFKSRIAGRFHKYLLVWGLLYAVNVGLVFVLTHVGFDVYIAGLLSIFPTTVLSFVLQRRLVFAD
ncbi:MAG: GtrA family protein [Alphaproteobacteria bacterium]